MFCLFHTFNPFWEELYQNPVQLFSVFPCGVPLPYSKVLQYYVKREKCKVNDVIFPAGCEAHTIKLDNKNMKIGNFTGGTSVRSKNIFTAISRYPTGKHEIIGNNFFFHHLAKILSFLIQVKLRMVWTAIETYGNYTMNRIHNLFLHVYVFFVSESTNAQYDVFEPNNFCM